jgi:hypothetical protein
MGFFVFAVAAAGFVAGDFGVVDLGSILMHTLHWR